jgi:hypothetical protein
VCVPKWKKQECGEGLKEKENKREGERERDLLYLHPPHTQFLRGLFDCIKEPN